MPPKILKRQLEATPLACNPARTFRRLSLPGFCTVATSEFELVLESFPGALCSIWFVVGELSDGTTVILHFVIADSDGDIRAEGVLLLKT